MANVYGRQVVQPLTNKSGGGVIAGDVVIIDTSNDTAFTTTTTGGYGGSVGIAQETIANNATGRVLTAGYAALVNVPSSQTRGHFIKTHTVVKQATGASSRAAGMFGQLLTGGTTPAAWLWGMTDNAGASGETVATSAIWDAKGDLAAGTAADTAAALTVGSNGQFLRANSAQSTGLEWVGMSVAADCSADVNLATDTMTDVTSCSVSLPAGTWEIDGWVTFNGNASYTVQAITDNSNVIQAESRGVASATGPTTWSVSARVAPGSTTTYKLRAQSNGNADVTKFGAGTAVGTRIRAIRVA